MSYKQQRKNKRIENVLSTFIMVLVVNTFKIYEYFQKNVVGLKLKDPEKLSE